MDQQANQANVSSQVYGGLAAVFRVFVFASIAIGVVLLVRIVYLFFGTLETAPGYDMVVSLTEPMVAPLRSLQPIKTPYDGVFDVAGTGTLLLVMVVEFILSSIRGSLAKKSEHALIQQIAARARATDHAPVTEDEPALKK